MDNQNIENAIDKLNTQNPFSGVIYIKNDSKDLFLKAYGQAIKSEEIKNCTNTRFGIASGTKLLTAIAISQLVEKKLLTYDSYLKDLIDIELKNFSPLITINHLLTHTSGIPDYFNEEEMTNYEALWETNPMYNMKEPSDFLPLFINEKMMFEPGSDFSYNNSGYILLGYIIEKLTNMKFTDYVKQSILENCDMLDSGFFSLDNLPKKTAYGYIKNELDESWKTNFYSIPIIGGADGGVYTTAIDFAKLWDNLLSNKLLSEETTKKLLHPHIQVNNNVFYGYGIWIIKNENDQIIKYLAMGQDPGVSFRSIYYPLTNTTIVILSNIDYDIYSLVKEIENTL